MIALPESPSLTPWPLIPQVFVFLMKHLGPIRPAGRTSAYGTRMQALYLQECLGEGVSGTKVQLVLRTTALCPWHKSPKVSIIRSEYLLCCPKAKTQQPGSTSYVLASGCSLFRFTHPESWKTRKRNQSGGRVSVMFILYLLSNVGSSWYLLSRFLRFM